MSGNLTKHMKSKSHGKKCLEKGVSESSVDELESEEQGRMFRYTGLLSSSTVKKDALSFLINTGV